MIYAVLVLGVIAGLSIMVAAWCYRELRTWARLANNCRIVLAYKGKVQVIHSLTDWMKWAQMLDEDELLHGRTVYRNANTALRLMGPKGFRKVEQ